ncbi:MAG: family 2 glycosyl transferase [Microgenomates group bacterium GW2011_GWC1_39_7b]|uniref:Family 2 glycosyl transferase n=3 Tax=Candidatus Woeseibacteriota TaxID=1752722 RepID=A0A0G0LLE1_9BACT|nr:MAG: family 2 glycosyl transferase [Candidatus Woesebacteria bacterium GW2011_GWB1_39_10]KKR27050.1 MAG: family 2 glycosyl transferase [Microgenomates group bacterium GW2011_GWC1_39_7b]KKR74132.1 MAG: family 2 glycosyl transferase [Candidatus Woesebacteria bacterium GW2011_GWA2_40_7]KKS90847.1 MAG: family 2 glycosyl transferase [Candidatus Woesebacteria bacterium GW2011_GWA1_43_12]
MNIELSIIIVNLNTKDLTVGCIRSIEKQAKNISFEVLLTDNGSNDGSVEAFKEIKEEKFWKKRFTLILNEANTGYAKANNQGIRRAKGKYIFLLNNDTVVHKDALQNLLKFVKNTPDAGVVGSCLLNIDGSLQMSCFNFPTITNAIKEYWLGQKGLFEKFAPREKTPVTVDSVVGAAFLITPAAKKSVGILDEHYFAYFEDIDYCRQTWKQGLKVYYLPDSVITHYHGATFKKLGDEANRWRKLIPSSKIYHGFFKHYIINAILWAGQKWQKIFQKN